MFNKKYIIILLLLIISICTLSAVSAADNATDAMATTEANDTVAIDETSADDVATNSEQDLEKAAEENDAESEKLSTSEEDYKLTVDESKDKLSLYLSTWYKIDLSDTTIKSNEKQTIYCYIKPADGTYGVKGYDFNFIVYDKNSNEVYKHHYAKTTDEAKKYPMTIAKDTLIPGIYVMVAENTYDGVMMDAAYLFVKGNADITATDYNANYMSGAKMTATLTDKVTKKPLTSLSVKVVFTNGKSSVTKYYTPNSNGQISFVPPVGVGTWTVQITPAETFISGSASKTITVKKTNVGIKAFKVSEYKGFKITLKATVKSYKKNVNEGTVLFKIKGKKYYAKVKNGVATKKIKLNKIKKYFYSATYLGTNNFYKSGKSVSKAIMKKSYKVKIYAPKNPSVYVGQYKKYTILVKTTDGKKVKNGWLKVKSRDGYTKAKVKNGKVKVMAYAKLADVYVKAKGDDSIYKKSVSHKYKIKYIPGSHKYKKAMTKYKATTKFRCHCGKTTTHSHFYYDYYYILHSYKIIVI